MTVIKNVAIFIGKHLCRPLFQSCSLEGCNFIIYKKLLHRFFPINFAKLFRTSVLQNTSRRLLLILFQIKEDISYKKYFFRFAYTNYFYFTFLKELGNYILCIKRRCKKHMNHLTHPLSSADIIIFSQEISKLYYIKKYRYGLHFDT